VTLTKEEAMEGLKAMQHDAAIAARGFAAQPVYWEGRQMHEVLYDIIEALEAPEREVHPSDEVCGCGHVVESHDEQGCVLCGYRCKEAYADRGPA